MRGYVFDIKTAIFLSFNLKLRFLFRLINNIYLNVMNYFSGSQLGPNEISRDWQLSDTAMVNMLTIVQKFVGEIFFLLG